ncbi:response regulator transcription factor [Embleya sp. NPDC050154]|uniref:response regulator transcription factor n=1 Tax=Embleya sp. NPDC050154 TaxID=3363988 RepID=UPI00378EE0B2
MGGEAARVLVVDDDEVIRQLIAVNLRLEGFVVSTARDGEECLRLVHEVRPDLVTLDVVMPHLDGIGTAARLRADPRTSGLKILMISACAQDEDFSRARAVGVDGYLTKPFHPEQLIRLVRALSPETGSGKEAGTGKEAGAGTGAATGVEAGATPRAEAGAAPRAEAGAAAGVRAEPEPASEVSPE